MKKRIFNLILLISLLSCTALGAFAHSAKIEISGNSDYKSVRLPLEVINNANYDLSDILIKDESNNIVPYFINSVYITKEINIKNYPMVVSDSFIKDDKQYFDVMLSEMEPNDIVGTSLEISVEQKNFVKDVEILGGYDGMNWEFVCTSTIYNVDKHIKAGVDLPNLSKYTHYRICVNVASDPINIIGVNLFYNEVIDQTNYFIEDFQPDFTVENIDKSTFIKLTGMQNIEINKIQIDTQSMFSRDIILPSGKSYPIYNLMFDDEKYTDTTINLNGESSLDDEYVLKINNYDDAPIEVQSITVSYFTKEIVFAGEQNSKYTLEFSGDSSISAPKYDIINYKSQILDGNIDALEISDIDFEQQETVPDQKDYSFIVNIVVVVTAVVLGFVILFNMKKR